MTIKLLEKSPLKLRFTNKLMTAYGGFALLSRLFERLDLENEVTNMMPFVEMSPNSTGVFAKVLKLGLTVAAGGYRYTHSAFLGDSTEIYEKSFGIKRIPKSITAVTRFFNRFTTMQDAEFFSTRLWEFIFRRVIPLKKIASDTLSFDSTVVTRYGNQEGSKKGYNPKKRGRKSHHPILAFLNETRYVVNLWNRSGNTSSGNGIVDFTKQTLARLNGRIKIKMILADSGFYRADFLDFIDEQNMEYTISAPMSRPLQDELYKMDAWRDLGDGISVAEFQFCHRNEKWIKNRRYLAIRKDLRIIGSETPGRQLSLFPEEDKKVFNFKYGLFVTSSAEPCEDLWRKYRLRANDENIIKENKEDFALEGFAQNGFYATEVAMLIRIMFYNILNLFRSEMLPEPESKKRLQTLRAKYFITPAVLGRDGKSPILRIGIRKQDIRQKFIYILNRITLYFNKGNAFESSSDPPKLELANLGGETTK